MKKLKLSTVFSVFAALLVSCDNPIGDSSEPSLDIAGNIDAFMGEALEVIETPVGVGIAVFTQEGSYASGFGVTDIETGEPVTADTPFYIASSTKSVNALVMNILHHRGELDLGATLAEYAPDAGFPDATLPSRVVLRDLLTHTSGIANTPISYRSAFTGEHTPELLWNLLAESDPNENAPYGSFQYTNTGYNILTVLTDRKLGIPWQDLVKREIIQPLGMTRTSARMSEAENLGWQIAKPHGVVTAEHFMERLYLEKVDSTMQSAGGMVMSPNDATLWLALFVNDGVVNGRQVIAPAIIKETRERLAQVDRQFGDYTRESYGLGWYISSYNNDVMIHHFGSFSGFRAHVSYLPERKLGVAVFVNDSLIGSYLADIVANYIYDLGTGRLSDRESVSAAIQSLTDRHRQIEMRVEEGRRIRDERVWQLSQPRSAYVGSYVSPRLGTITVSLVDNELFVEMGVMHAIGTPYMEPDAVRVELAPTSGTVIRFDVDDGGSVTAINYLGERLERI